MDHYTATRSEAPGLLDSLSLPLTNSSAFDRLLPLLDHSFAGYGSTRTGIDSAEILIPSFVRRIRLWLSLCCTRFCKHAWRPSGRLAPHFSKMPVLRIIRPKNPQPRM